MLWIERLLTRILEQTPCSANLMARVNNAVAQFGVALLQSVGKVDARYAGANNDDVIVDVLISVRHRGNISGWTVEKKSYVGVRLLLCHFDWLCATTLVKTR